jgi:hypothetical protein
MSISVKSLIDQYTNLQQLNESETEIQLEGELASLETEEKGVLSALSMGVVIEKILNERREARS